MYWLKLIAFVFDRGASDGMAVAAGYSGEVMYLLPYTILGRDLEPRATEILVQVSGEMEGMD